MRSTELPHQSILSPVISNYCVETFFLQERQAREEALSQDEIYRTPTPVPAADSTWLQVQELEVSILVKEKHSLFQNHLTMKSIYK